MERNYAMALWKSIERGNNPKAAVSALIQSLQTHGRSALLPRVIAAFKRVSERELRRNETRVLVADQKDALDAMKAAGVSQAEVCVDASLIGGWRIERSETLIDASYKKMLLDMYNRATS
ncbi:MAG: hypothetical protein RIQ56_952 [Candidatus Parcubacteria bacterium]